MAWKVSVLLIVVIIKEIKRDWCIWSSKQQQDWYAWHILESKWYNTVELTYLEANKQETKYR